MSVSACDPGRSLTPSNVEAQPPGRPPVEERLATLEAKLEYTKWWRNPGWWGVILSAFVGLSGLVWQTKAWELFQDDDRAKQTVRVIDAHASAFAKNERDADLRVLNRTSRDIVVERVTAVFGHRTYGQSCRHGGRATRVLYPVSQLRAGSTQNLFQRIRPGEGAPFKCGPNRPGVRRQRPCPLPVTKLQSPQDTVTFIVFTNDGTELQTKRRLFYEPRAYVGAGVGVCFCHPSRSADGIAPARSRRAARVETAVFARTEALVARSQSAGSRALRRSHDLPSARAWEAFAPPARARWQHTTPFLPLTLAPDLL